ncbi:hypothetical protein [uncultured Pseudodesulfovibrio sp.]|uniref:hypothetical protein n=1 Tax=uncultured Pseudodesulfovibrio sp. TaxID=2035858 RepID=UPI0029C72C5B|nr:hypothetical protein [uncultured Pseudodesulfovibrio sp.]
MSQQTIMFPASPCSGADLIARLGDIFDSVLSNRKGNLRPSDVQVGETWLDDSAGATWVLKLWTGVVDIPLFTINSSAGTFLTSVANGGTGAVTPAQARINLGLEIGADVAAVAHTHTGIYEPIISKLSGFNLPLADATKAQGGTDNACLMTPLRTEQWKDTTIASQAVAEAGINNTELMTALRTKQAIAALASGGMWEYITTIDASAAVASMDFTGLSVGRYRFVFRNAGPTGYDVDLGAQYYVNGVLTTTGHESSCAGTSRNRAVIPQFYTSGSPNIVLARKVAGSSYGYTGDVYLEINPSWSSMNWSLSGIYYTWGIGSAQGKPGVNGVRFKGSSGNIMGKIELYKMIEV